MEILRTLSPNRRKAVSILLSGVALTGCSSENYEIKSEVPAVVVDKYEQSQYIPANETTDYARYESTFWLVIQQCQRENEPIADNSGCVVMQTQVNDKVFADYQKNEPISFINNVTALPLERPQAPPVSAP